MFPSLPLNCFPCNKASKQEIYISKRQFLPMNYSSSLETEQIFIQKSSLFTSNITPQSIQIYFPTDRGFLARFFQRISLTMDVTNFYALWWIVFWDRYFESRLFRMLKYPPLGPISLYLWVTRSLPNGPPSYIE